MNLARTTLACLLAALPAAAHADALADICGAGYGRTLSAKAKIQAPVKASMTDTHVVVTLNGVASPQRIPLPDDPDDEFSLRMAVTNNSLVAVIVNGQVTLHGAFQMGTAGQYDDEDASACYPMTPPYRIRR
jgi:hypothetical protein